MELLEVVSAGLFTTIQDLGRFGSQRYGVPTSGAMDGFALRAANRLVGNADELAGLEITMGGVQLRASAPVVFAITGADLEPRLNDRPVPMWQGLVMRGGDTLDIDGAADGVRAYLAVRGGIDVPLVLGSRSTYTKSKLGGIDGRVLRRGDRLHGGPAASVEQARLGLLPAALVPHYGTRHDIRVVLGPQDDRFTPEGIHTFLSSTYRVSLKSDRTGCRLEGPRIAHVAGPDIVSDGSPPGAVQVAGDGMPIVLLADRGTAGGYTKIATVITADLMHLAQAGQNDEVAFRPVTVDEARAALFELEQVLDAIVVMAETGKARRSARAVAAAAAAVAATIYDDTSPGS